MCVHAADDVEEHVVTKTTKIIDKSAAAAGLSDVVIVTVFFSIND